MIYEMCVWAGFNTQPPEGGWAMRVACCLLRLSFNTQPPEGGWNWHGNNHLHLIVSTHSRLKAAGPKPMAVPSMRSTGFNTQPPEGGWRF